VIRNGIEAEAPRLPDRATVRANWGIAPDVPLLGFGGRLVAQKQPERVIELFAALCETPPAARLVLCGDGPLQGALLERVHRAPWGERVQFQPPEAVSGLLSAADLLLAPSLHEGLPYLLLEAMAAGLPLLATPVGGVTELLSGPALEPGLAEWDLGEWTHRVKRLLTDAPLRAAWKAAATERLGDYRSDAMVDATLALYRTELARRV